MKIDDDNGGTLDAADALETCRSAAGVAPRSERVDADAGHCRAS
jgi:hypothetical protein